MKQNLKLGNMVDDGTGDYLRAGGGKINNNFDELYYELGDGDRPHSAGAWKTWTQAQGNPLVPKFGQSFAINTSNGRVEVNLPKGTAADYNKVIRLRDVWRSWQRTHVVLRPAPGDTIKGSAGLFELKFDLMDVEMVYCNPGRWEFLENKRVDKLTNSELATVARKEFVATEGQRDFLDIFKGNKYNAKNIKVFHRGNLLYFGDVFSADSDYGSPAGNDVGPLNGSDIRLRRPCVAGDVISVETFMDGVGTWRSSYTRRVVRFVDKKFTDKNTVQGETWVGDLPNTHNFKMVDLGIAGDEVVNPFSIEVLLNGRQLTQAGQGGFPGFYCEGDDSAETEQECIDLNGKWKSQSMDYSFGFSGEVIESINFDTPLEHQDILVLRWFNNDIGTTMTLEEIIEETDELYLNTENTLSLTGLVEYTDIQHPSQKTMRKVADNDSFRVQTLQNAFDVFHPIGSIYENAHNPANPATYMGMGTWVRYSEGQVTVGWTTDPTDPLFALNNNDLDAQGNPSHTAGGTGGSINTTIEIGQIPELTSKSKVLIADENGNIVIGGCQFDPDAEGPGYSKYREDHVKVNEGIETPKVVGIVQPFVTSHKWVRVA